MYVYVYFLKYNNITITAAVEVFDGLKPMDTMQKAVSRNMEKTLTTPIFRVSKYVIININMVHICT